VVRGKGNQASLKSASHGAGRLMSRTQAKQKFNFNSERRELAARGVTILSAGADEVPGVYKDIEQVMAEQADLVSIVARFDPKIVKMSDDGKSED
jgi:tRNA-splicing ligase RtcB